MSRMSILFGLIAFALVARGAPVEAGPDPRETEGEFLRTGPNNGLSEAPDASATGK